MTQLSAIIPTIGRGPTLARVLDRLGGQDAPPGSFEAVVVLDAKLEDPDAVRDAVGERPYRVRVLSASVPGASGARNHGWRAAEGPLVLFLGDDILPERRLVSEHLEWHRRHPEEEVGVLGFVRWARELRQTPFMRWLDHGMQFDYDTIKGTEAGWGHFHTANASLKRSFVERVSGFDEERLPFGYEDVDLAYRLDRIGFRLLYNRRASAEHLHPATFEEWRRRMRRAARTERDFVRIHPEIPPYFRRMFERAASQPPARGRGRHLIRFVPRRFPWLGPKLWKSADLYYRQALAPDFFAGWEGASSTTEAPDDYSPPVPRRSS